MKSFTIGKNEYELRQNIGCGVQWKCIHDMGGYTVESWAFIPKKNPTRSEIIDAIERVNQEEQNEM